MADSESEHGAEESAEQESEPCTWCNASGFRAFAQCTECRGTGKAPAPNGER